MQRNNASATLSPVQLPEAEQAASRWREGEAGFILTLVGLSGALALAWAGLWLVIGSNIRTSTRYRAARRRPPAPGGAPPPDGLRVLYHLHNGVNRVYLEGSWLDGLYPSLEV